MSVPPPYPRTPYLDDDPDAFVARPCRIEEKLDGANVAVWLDGRQLRVMSRGGPDAMDRAGQLGRLRAWVAERDKDLRHLCSDGTVAYGEWLWLRHGIPYDQLPDWFVLLDLWRLGGFVDVDVRDSSAIACGLVTPPLVAGRATVGSAVEAQALIPHAAWGPTSAEGIVLRRGDGRRAKVVRPGFTQRSDDDWAGPAEHNSLARSSAS